MINFSWKAKHCNKAKKDMMLECDVSKLEEFIGTKLEGNYDSKTVKVCSTSSVTKFER
jgi:hypothetical protein